RLRHLARLAVAEANAALLVADDDERGKAEAAAALHHLGDTVDVDELVDELAVALLAVTAAIAAFPAFLCHYPDPCSFPVARLKLSGSVSCCAGFRSSGRLHARPRPAP